MIAGILSLLSSWSPLTITDEVRWWAKAYRVNPDLAQAVAIVESGERDGLVSKTGDYGRMQINCATWRKAFGLEKCSELLQPHLNALLGVKILHRYKKRFAGRDGMSCCCYAARETPHWWVAHYNSGNRLTSRSLAYQSVVRWHVKRLVKERAEKRAGRS